MKQLLSIALVALIPAVVIGQDAPNRPFAALIVNAAVTPVSQNPAAFPTPQARTLHTDSPLIINARGGPSVGGTPIVLAFAASTTPGATLVPASLVFGDVQIDIPDTGAPGYSDQMIVNGYEAPAPSSFTDPGGFYSICINVPACITLTGGALSCLANATFEVGVQGLVVDPTATQGISATGTVRGDFINGFELFDFTPSADDEFAVFDFKNGFTFTYWGETYTRAFVSENGFIQFGGTENLSGFQNPGLNQLDAGGPRICSWFSDLDPEVLATSPRIFAQQFTDKSGFTKVKFTHQGVSEFMSQTGGHAGEIVIDEDGGIAVYAPSSNLAISINTLIGISRGNNTQSSLYGGPNGRDLTALFGTAPVSLGPNMPAVELFNAPGGANGMDMVGFNQFPVNPFAVGPGITFLPDPLLPGIPGGYILQ